MNVNGFGFTARSFTCGCDVRRLSRVRNVMCDIRRRVVIISNAVDLWVNKDVNGIIVVYNTADGSGLFGTSVGK